MTPVRLEPAAPQSRVKHSTTESPIMMIMNDDNADDETDKHLLQTTCLNFWVIISYIRHFLISSFSSFFKHFF